ncbi:hypothetical protein [Facklamia sp. P13069]
MTVPTAMLVGTFKDIISKKQRKIVSERMKRNNLLPMPSAKD